MKRSKMLYSAVLALVVALLFFVPIVSVSAQSLVHEQGFSGRVVMLEKITDDGKIYLMDHAGNVYQRGRWGLLYLVGQINPEVGQTTTALGPGFSPDYGYFSFEGLRNQLGAFIGEKIGVRLMGTFAIPPNAQLDFLPVQRLSVTSGEDFFTVPAESLNPGRHLLTVDQGKIGWSGLIVYPGPGESYLIAASIAINGKLWEVVPPGTTVRLDWQAQWDPAVDRPTISFENFGATNALSGSFSFVANESSEVYLAIRSQYRDQNNRVHVLTTTATAFVQVKR